MKGYEVSQVVIEDIAADTVFAGIFGEKIRLGGTGPLEKPLLEYWKIGESENELFAPVTLQFDAWLATDLELNRVVQRLRRKYHQDVPVVIGGLGMWCQYVDDESLASPDRDGYFAHATRFRFTPLRDRYQPAPTL